MNTLVASLAIAIAQPIAGPPPEPDFAQALRLAELTPATARFDPVRLPFFVRGEFTAPLYRLLNDDPWQAPSVMAVLRGELAGTAGTPSNALIFGGRMAGYGTRRTLLGNPNAAEEEAAQKPGALVAALESMGAQGLLAGSVPSLQGVPEPAKQAAALLVRTALRVRENRRLAFADLGNLEPVFQTLSRPGDDSLTSTDQRLRWARATNLGYLAAGGHDLLLAMQAAQNLLKGVPPDARFEVRVATAWGPLVLTGGSDSRHEGPSFLVLDTGGNDVYVQAGANASASNWASLVLDTAGDDRYLSDPALERTEVASWDGRARGGSSPGPAGALLGYAFVLDAAGNDLYRSHRPAQGSAMLGCAALVDGAGDDVYDAYRDAQGFGMFGVGILEDASGNDRYHAFFQAQGCGQTGGAGLLLDRAGNDRYLANDEVLDFPSPQSAKNNTSMSQGCGFGRRADYSDNQSLSGGVGILLDQEGDDAYACGVFGQGVGYWQGVGALLDGSGNDVYQGQWYVQGASAHFAIGYLEDASGADQYTAGMNMAQGAGHDFGFGMLIERGGNDKYQSPNLSLGAGNANGLGMFFDGAGDDAYSASGLTLGRGTESPEGSLRTRALCLGVFVDAAGADTYPDGVPHAKNGSEAVQWTRRFASPAQSQLGIFRDRP